MTAVRDRSDIADPVVREIAYLMDAQELGAQYGPRVAAAYSRAAIDGGSSAQQALRREIGRAEEEEDFLMLAVMLYG